MRLMIDGQDFTNDVQGLDDISLIFGLNTSDSLTSVSVSGELEFAGNAFDLLHTTFFENTREDIGSRLVVQLFLDCCNQKDPILFYLDRGSVRICGDCMISGNLIKLEDDESCRSYLRDKIFWKDNGFLDSVPFYDIPYCEESDAFTKIYIIIFTILFPILLVLQAIETVINAVLRVIRFISFGLIRWSVDIPSLDNAIRLIRACDRKHPSPRVFDILDYNVRRCGLKFDSNILKYTYANTLILMAQNEDGCTSCSYIESNLLNKTTVQLMNDLKPVWNADYRIIGDTLYFDWKKRINMILDEYVLCNAESEYDKGDAEDPPCYSYDTNLPAYMRFEYSHDSIDTAGNKRLDTYRADGKERGNYAEIIEWNDPPSQYQKGEETVILPYSPPAFTHDGRNRCDISQFRMIDKYGLGTQPNQLVLTMGMSSLPKLILMNSLSSWDPWREGTGEVKGCIANALGGAFVYDVQQYNTFLWTKEDKYEGLYSQYYKIDDPRGEERPLLNLESFTFAFDCEQLALVMQNGVNVAVETEYGNGYPTEIRVDFRNNTMTLNGVKV